MAYTAVNTYADDGIYAETKRSCDSMTPIQRYSSDDIIPAAQELRFTVSAQQKPSQPKNAHHTVAHLLKINELESEFSTSLQDGLNHQQIELKREMFGWNVVSPLRNTHCLVECLTDPAFWCLIVSLILCIVITVMMPNIYCIVVTVVTFIEILLLIILTLCNRTITNRFEEFAPGERSVTVIRKADKARYQLLIAAMIRKNECKAPSEVRDLIVAYSHHATDGYLVDAKELVVGDIVNIKKGEKIPADLRIFECSDDCQVDNSGLTGESEPQQRNSEPSNDVPAEARNLLFCGTLLVEGNAKCVCFAIGDSTFMGKTVQLYRPTQYGLSYDEFYGRPITICKQCWSFVLCLVTLIFFFLFLFIIPLTNEVIFLIWFILTLIIVVFASFAVGLFWFSRYYLLHQIRNNYNIYASRVSVDTLGMMNVLVIGDDELCTRAILKCHDLGIKLVIITDKNLGSAKLMLEGVGIENETYFISFDSTELAMATDRYYAHDAHVNVGWNFNDYENVIVFKTPKEMHSSLLIVASLQEELGVIVGFIGLSMNNRSAFKKADVSIAADKYVSDAVKDVADAVCLEEGAEALDDVMAAIEVSRKFRKYFGWSLGSCHWSMCDKWIY